MLTMLVGNARIEGMVDDLHMSEFTRPQPMDAADKISRQ